MFCESRASNQYSSAIEDDQGGIRVWYLDEQSKIANNLLLPYLYLLYFDVVSSKEFLRNLYFYISLVIFEDCYVFTSFENL